MKISVGGLVSINFEPNLNENQLAVIMEDDILVKVET